MNGRLHLGPLLSGFALLLACIRLLGIYPSFAKFGGGHGPAGRNLSFIGEGEFRFWLAMFLLATPACVAMAYGFERRLGPWLRRTVHRIDGWSHRQWRSAAVAYLIGLFTLALLGNAWLLLGHPITDDEGAVRFGGQLWAAGHTLIPTLEPDGAWNDLYMYRRGDLVGPMDWPGVIAAAALAVGTGLGSGVYAALAAITGLAVTMTAKHLFGSRGALLAALVWALSPMAFTLSVTNHAHVVSRCWVALAIHCVARLWQPAEGQSPWRVGGALGLLVGIGGCTRPFETGALMAPVGVALLVQGLRGREAFRPALWACLLGLVPPLLAHALYNQHMTGELLTAPRMSDAIVGATTHRPMSVWDRVGLNLGHNLLMLAVWFWGPLGVALAWIGGAVASPVPRMLVAGVCTSLLVALGHEDVGIHAVGPIHYSETAVPLTLLAVGGLLEGLSWMRARGIGLQVPAVAFSGYAAAMAFFVVQYCGSLQLQGEFQDFPYGVLRHHEVERGLVLAPPPAVRDSMEPLGVGSWQLMEPHPDPFLRADLLFPRAHTDVAALHARLPDRRIYRLYIYREGPRLVEVDPMHPERTPPQPLPTR